MVHFIINVFRLSIFTDIRASPEWKQIDFTPIFASIFLNSSRNIMKVNFTFIHMFCKDGVLVLIISLLLMVLMIDIVYIYWKNYLIFSIHTTPVLQIKVGICWKHKKPFLPRVPNRFKSILFFFNLVWH